MDPLFGLPRPRAYECCFETQSVAQWQLGPPEQHVKSLKFSCAWLGHFHLLREHATCLTAARVLLEDPQTECHSTIAAQLQRAAVDGHTWLSRIALKAHADKLVQPALLASVRAPSVTYVPAIPRRIAKTGALSEPQLEALFYAGQCHSQPLRPSGSRNGFLLADGAGVGKGRTQSAIILDSWWQGHQKALWVRIR